MCVCVRVCHLCCSYNNKTYRIDDIDWNQSPNSKFTKSDKVELSFSEYYKQVGSPFAVYGAVITRGLCTDNWLLN